MFKAILIERDDRPYRANFTELNEAQLPAGDVRVRVGFSTLNYKDALAISGKAPVVRQFPMVPGIDFAGIVEESENAAYRAGDGVVLNGWGVGEHRWGGLAQLARVKGEWLIPLPAAKPLGKERWAGAIDVVGSHTLANVCASMSYRGVVAACGLAGGLDFTATVAPFILRGVTLAGVDSVMCPRVDRLEAWRRLGQDLDVHKLE